MIKKEPEGWIDSSRAINRMLFSELETLLRALDRFFYVENPPGNKNFHSELFAARDVVLRVLSILEIIIPESRRNEYWFLKYAEAKLLSEHKRDLYREEMLKQDSSEKSLILIYDSFINLKTIITDLLKNKNISYISFNNIGHLISTHVRENVFFNPFRQNIDRDMDAIDNGRISSMVRNIRDRAARKAVSVIIIHLFRLLRFLNHIDLVTQRYVAMHSSLLILLLLRSEIDVFILYLEHIHKKTRNKSLQSLLKSIAYQFSMESKRVYEQELKDVFVRKPYQMRGHIENAHGIIKNLTEQSVIQIAQFWRPEAKGEDIFESFTNKTDLSLKLREDMYVLKRLIEILVSGEPPAGAAKALRGYMKYFESFTFRLLRHDDYEEFAGFFDDLEKAGMDDESLPKLLETCRHFAVYLDTALGHVSNRAELKDRTLDTDAAEETIINFLQEEV